MHFSDKPVVKESEDILDMTPMINELNRLVISSTPPIVLGVHGDWGAGKTSFLNLLKNKLDSDEKHLVIFFEAWKYQHDPNPVIALLHEIRLKLSTSQKIWGKAKKLTEVTLRSGLAHLESATSFVAASSAQKEGEEWEARHMATCMPSDVIRTLLNDAIKSLLGNSANHRLVVIIDDLDRCSSKTAFRLLEGIKIYLNIETCVFILGLNEREIRRAILEHLPGKVDNQDQEVHVRALEYLEKLCENIRRLPLVDADQEKKMINKWIGGDSDIVTAIKERLCEFSPCLPANPRRIKAFCNLINHYISTYSTNHTNKISVKNVSYLMPILAYIQLFHYDLHRVIQRNPTFYNLLLEFLKEAESENPNKYKVFDSIQRSITAIKNAGDQTPESSSFESLFRDPAFGPVFHMQKLLISAPVFKLDELKEFLRY